MKRSTVLALTFFWLILSGQAQSDSTYNGLLARYKQCTSCMSNTDKLKLIHLAFDSGFRQYAGKIVQDYGNNLSEQEMLLPKNIELIFAFPIEITDKGFTLLLQHPKEIDQVFHSSSWASKKAVEIIVANNLTKASSSTEPDWDSLQNKMKRQYGNDLATRIVMTEKIKFFNAKKQWKEFALANNTYIQRYGKSYYDSDVDLNNAAWDIFENCDDTASLNMAIQWISPMIHNTSPKPHYLYIDTYSNLLYKTGRKDEAIQWEKKVIEITKQKPTFVAVLRKMEAGEKTW